MRVVYDRTRPAGVGSIMSVGSWDGTIAGVSAFTLVAMAAGGFIVYKLLKR